MKNLHAIMMAFALQAQGVFERKFYFNLSSKSYDNILHKHRKHRRGRPKE